MTSFGLGHTRMEPTHKAHIYDPFPNTPTKHKLWIWLATKLSHIHVSGSCVLNGHVYCTRQLTHQGDCHIFFLIFFLSIISYSYCQKQNSQKIITNDGSLRVDFFLIPMRFKAKSSMVALKERKRCSWKQSINVLNYVKSSFSIKKHLNMIFLK